MPRTRSKRKTSPQRARNIAPAPQLAIVPAPEKPVRGVKLKTVSRFAMVFAVLCLGAFIAGRADVAAMNQPTAVSKTRTVVSESARGHKRAIANRAKSGTRRSHAAQSPRWTVDPKTNL
jgi:hypothetical protein